MSFIVIEGLDGSGKSTQIKMLKKYLDERNISYEYLHFPRTDAPVYGELIARFLRGEMGGINEIDPYLVALIYAGDRDSAKGLMRKWLEQNKLVLADRYVLSNIAFQCAKLKDPAEVLKLKKWILNLEYNVNQLPVPDINIFLNVPFSFTRRQLERQRTGDDRNYLQGASDIHEKDLEFQQHVRQIYLSMENELSHYRVLNCTGTDGQILPPGEIFHNLRNLISSLI